MTDPIFSLSRKELVYSVILAVYCTLAIMTNFIGSKLFEIAGVVLPVSILWFPFTFLITDICSEVFGSTRSYLLVVLGFAVNLVMLSMVQVGISIEPSSLYNLNKEYVAVFTPSFRLFGASMAAFLIAQMIDVKIFHYLKEMTQGRHLWLRNNLSTLCSQLADTFVVSFLFMYKNPEFSTSTANDIFVIALTTYTVKLIIALLDTPLCYLGIYMVRGYLKKDFQ